MLLSELVGKLPPSLRLDWGLHTQRVPQVSLRAFSDYVTSIKTAACKVSLPTDSHADENRRSKKEKGGSLTRTPWRRRGAPRYRARKRNIIQNPNRMSLNRALRVIIVTISSVPAINSLASVWSKGSVSSISLNYANVAWEATESGRADRSKSVKPTDVRNLIIDCSILRTPNQTMLSMQARQELSRLTVLAKPACYSR